MASDRNGSREVSSRIRLDRKAHLAARARLLEVVTLQDRWTTVRIAVRAKEMAAIRAAMPLLQRIHMVTGWRSVEFVALKLTLRLLNALQFVLKEQSLRFHKTALGLRLLNCSGDLFKGRFDLGFASAIRRLDQVFQSPGDTQANLHRPANISGALGEVIYRLDVEAAHFMASWRDMQKLSRVVFDDARAAGTPAPDQEGAA